MARRSDDFFRMIPRRSVVVFNIAVCWAATYAVPRWFIGGIVFFNLAMVALNTVLSDTPIGISEYKPSLLTQGVIAALLLARYGK